MTNRERMVAVLAGNKPDRIPLATYGGRENDDKDPLWEELYDQGLCYMPRVWAVRMSAPDVEEIFIREKDSRGYDVERRILRTSAGDVEQLKWDGWVREYFLKTPSDYRVMKYIVDNTRLEPEYDAFIEAEKRTGEKGVTIARGIRTPMQTVIVDYAGLENFSYHLADEPAEVESLMEILLDQLVNYCRIAAQCPCRYFQIRENLTSEQIGPVRYKNHHMAVYEKIIPILHAGGKIVFAHYDGKIACLTNLIAQTELDGIESLTSPPEGDITYGAARNVIKDKIFMCNIGLSDYYLPPDEFKAKIVGFINQASVGGRKLLFEISEDLPKNWRQSLPVELEALANYEI